MVVHTCNSNTQEALVGRSPVQGLTGENMCQKKKKAKINKQKQQQKNSRLNGKSFFKNLFSKILDFFPIEFTPINQNLNSK
jgi:hypothetical protein